MKRVGTLLLAVVFLCAARAGAQTPSIAGTVTDAATAAPIENAILQLYDANGQTVPSGERRTDAAGHYQYSSLAPGSYFLKVSTFQAQYIHQLHNGIPCVAADCVPPIGPPLIVSSDVTTTADFALVVGGRITGTIRRASDNVVLPNLNVLVYSASGSLVKIVMSITDGTYTVAGLPSGTYFARTTFALAPFAPATLTMIPEMYGGAHCPNAFQSDCRVIASTPIAVTTGATTAGIDFSLDEGGRIAGRVTAAASGTPLVGVQLSAYFGDVEVAITPTMADGTYEFLALPPGNYRVRTRMVPDNYVHEWHNDVCVGCSGTPAAVAVAAGATVGGIDFALSTGASITGTVTCPSGGFIQEPRIDAFNAAGVFVRSGVKTGTIGTPTIGCTAFTYAVAGLPPGQYYLLARDFPARPFNPFIPTGGYLIDHLYGGIDCVTVDCDVRRGVPIAVGAGGMVPNVDFVMRGGFSIQPRFNGQTTRFTDTISIYDSRGVPLQSVNLGDGMTGGHYLVGLPAGTYYIKVNGTLYRSLTCVDCPPTAGNPVVLGAVSFPSTVDVVSTASPVQVVSGTVRDAAGVAALSSIAVELLSDAGVVIATATTNLDGVYRIAGIPPGTYFARTRNARGFVDELFADGDCPTCNPTNGTPIVVSGAPVTGIDFTLAAAGTITGTVADNAGVVLANVPVSLFTAGGSLVGRAVSSASGLFSFEAAAGSYRARADVTGTHGSEVFDNTACTSGACDVAAGTPIAVTTGVITPNINFSLTPCSSMTLSPSLLATAVVGRAYRQVFSVSGGTGPMTYQLTAGVLPTGLTLNASTGVLAGTPTASGRHQLTIGAVDANGCATARPLTLDVHECAFVLSPSTATVPAAGGTVTINIIDACGAQDVQNPFSSIHVESNVPGQVVLRVDPNPGGPWSTLLTIGRRVFTLRQAGTSSLAPFGSFDAPLDGSQVSGSVALGGWALDNFEVARVQIYRDPVGGEGVSQIFLGNAVFVRGARPDVARAYPTYPFSDRAGWGFLILTNMLPNQGNGAFRVYAYADDTEGGRTLLGAKTIIAANASATTPFGAIDTPAQGATINGTGYLNFGWALTPQPKIIPFDGTTIDVLIDGAPVGHPTYNQFRADVAALFPGLANSNGAVGYRAIDTTALAEGQHTIAWVVRDSAGEGAGIGSRYFHVANSADADLPAASGVDSGRRIESVTRTPTADVQVARADTVEPQRIDADEAGARVITLKAMERLELKLGDQLDAACTATWTGYLVENKTLGRLPVGATMDPAGTFYWHPGPGFLGTFQLLFVRTACDGGQSHLPVRVIIGR